MPRRHLESSASGFQTRPRSSNQLSAAWEWEWGASWAGGCTIGNAMVETAQFSFQGWISFLFMFLGVGLGTKVFVLDATHRAPAAAELRTAVITEGGS